MKILNDGRIQVEDQFELNYQLLAEMELELKPDGTIYDPKSNSVLSFNGMIIKCSIDPDNIHYASAESEIEFNILGNVRMITTLFGLYLKRRIDDGMPYRAYSPDEIMIDDIKYSNLTVKFDDYNEISTEYFHNKCLKFIQMIFLLEEDNIDLKNIDELLLSQEGESK